MTKEGIEIIVKNELLIRGKKEDLLELSDYIKEVATSENKNDHIHLDNLTIINSNSKIKELIIEKEEN